MTNHQNHPGDRFAGVVFCPFPYVSPCGGKVFLGGLHHFCVGRGFPDALLAPLDFVGRDVVLAKSASLCFRLTAKMRSAPLLVLSPEKRCALSRGP